MRRSLALSVEESSPRLNFTPKRYGIVGLVGPRETGKSTWMVKKIVKEAITRRHYKKFFCALHIGIKVDKHGYHYGFPGVQFITYEDFMQIHEPSPGGVPTALVGVDQIHRWFDSRKSTSNHNVETSDKIIQSRQHGFDIITTTWARSLVDLRLRRFYEMLINTKRGKNCFLYDYWDTDTGYITTKKMNMEQARDTFRYFDTSEEVLPPKRLDAK